VGQGFLLWVVFLVDFLMVKMRVIGPVCMPQFHLSIARNIALSTRKTLSKFLQSIWQTWL
jgi:hypothetical protein